MKQLKIGKLYRTTREMPWWKICDKEHREVIVIKSNTIFLFLGFDKKTTDYINNTPWCIFLGLDGLIYERSFDVKEPGFDLRLVGGGDEQ